MNTNNAKEMVNPERIVLNLLLAIEAHISRHRSKSNILFLFQVQGLRFQVFILGLFYICCSASLLSFVRVKKASQTLTCSTFSSLMITPSFKRTILLHMW